MGCKRCLMGDPMSKAHYHIVVKNGVVTEVWYTDGYWDHELEKGAWFVEYTDNPIKTWLIKTVQAVKIPKLVHTGKPDTDDWIMPKLYTGASKEPSTMAKIVSGIRTVHDMFRLSVDHAKRLFR
jgi:hypothetical protein